MSPGARGSEEVRDYWPIHIINRVDKTEVSCNTTHRSSTTVSLETYPLYSLHTPYIYALI